MSRLLKLSLFTLLLASFVWAQFGSGFQGTVVDHSGAVIPGVMVRVTNTDTGVVREVTSSANGVYVVPSLGPGNYKVQVLKEGFVSATQESLVLPPNETRKVDFTLEVGSVRETINVTGQATVLETEVGRPTSQINQAVLAELPVPNNNLFNLMALQPGVTGRSLGTDNISGRSTAGVNFAGARTDSNSYSMDNMTANSVSRGGASEITPNLESVEQVSIATSNASASEGRNMGAHVNIVSKAGTNQLHGSLWNYFQNNTLGTRNFFDTTTSALPSRRNQFGYAVGGPVVKNRTFFFTSYEGIRSSGSAAVSTTVETKEFTDFILKTRPNSIAAKLYTKLPPAAYPTTNFLDLGSPTPGVAACGGCAAANVWNRTADGIPEVGTARYTRKSSSESNQFTGRVDHELRPGKDRLYGYYYHFHGVSKTPPLRDSEVDNPTTGNFVNLNETHIFSPTTLNELQFGIVRYIGIYTTPPHLDVPVINITSGAGSFQDTNPYPGGWFPTEYIVKDSVSLVRGSHTIKFGAERRRNDNNLKHTASYIPAYSFASPLTFANDTALSMNRTVNPVTGQPSITYASQRITEAGAYLQDDWKVKRNLTFNLGLRYEYFGPYTDAKDRLSNFLPGPGATVAQQIASGKGDKVQQSWDPNKLDIGPRLGFAWDIGGKGQNVIRGSWALSYDRMATVYPAGYRNNPPLIGIVTAGTQFGTAFTYSLGDLSKSQYLGFPRGRQPGHRAQRSEWDYRPEVVADRRHRAYAAALHRELVLRHPAVASR